MNYAMKTWSASLFSYLTTGERVPCTHSIRGGDDRNRNPGHRDHSQSLYWPRYHHSQIMLHYVKYSSEHAPVLCGGCCKSMPRILCYVTSNMNVNMLPFCVEAVVKSMPRKVTRFKVELYWSPVINHQTPSCVFSRMERRITRCSSTTCNTGCVAIQLSSPSSVTFAHNVIISGWTPVVPLLSRLIMATPKLLVHYWRHRGNAPVSKYYAAILAGVEIKFLRIVRKVPLNRPRHHP